MTAAPRTGLVAERRTAYTRLRSEGMTIGLAAERLRVNRRTADRYERWLRATSGLRSRQRPAWWMWEPILDHLHAYPHLAFSGDDLGRVLGGSSSTARRALRAMVAMGLVELIVEPMNDRDRRPVSRFRLAVQEEAMAA